MKTNAYRQVLTFLETNEQIMIVTWGKTEFSLDQFCRTASKYDTWYDFEQAFESRICVYTKDHVIISDIWDGYTPRFTRIKRNPYVHITKSPH